ncbi:MAG: tripartite tricarboxylate transporter TctB family protein [Alphaproteobacteria bacterium]|nr:tripartite tricarboxylate transporter TctB family protein [Alphaproteobacteria bacterium]
MIDRNLARGLFCALVAIGFGLGALRYPVGNLAHAGPGFFPLTVSCLLLAVALMMIARSRFTTPAPLQFNWKNIAYVVAGLVSLVLASAHVSMILGIFLLVFISALGGASYSWKRNLIVSAALVAVAFGFQTLLGLDLGLL